MSTELLLGTLVLVAIGNQHRLLDARQVVRRLAAPRMDRLQLGGESPDRDRLDPVMGALLQPSQEIARRPVAVRSAGEER